MAGMAHRDKMTIIRARVRNKLNESYEVSKLRYDQRARTFHATPGQEVYQRLLEELQRVVRKKVPTGAGGEGGRKQRVPTRRSTRATP